MEIKLKLKGVETGEIALCSPKHFETLNKFNWWSNSDDYPETSWKNGKGGKITMHMYVVNIIEGLETPKGYFIDQSLHFKFLIKHQIGNDQYKWQCNRLHF